MITLEQKESETILFERLSTWSLPRLKEEGYCLTGLSAFWLEENRFSRPVAIFLLGPGISLPEHRFEIGSQVVLSRENPLNELECPRGSVMSKTANQIRVAFWEPFEGVDCGEWRMDVGYSAITFDRMRGAIAHLNQDPAELEDAVMADNRQLILYGTHLRDILLRSSQPLDVDDAVRNTSGAFKDDQRIHSWAQRYSKPSPLVMEGDPPLEGLNGSQIRAVAMMIGERLSLVQGPPGTGKTMTIIQAIKLLKTHFEVPHPLLVCTYTNVAVDNLVEGLAAAGVRPLRVGFGGQVRESLEEHTLDYKLDHHPLKPSLDALGEKASELSSRVREIAEKIVQVEGKAREAATANARERAAQIVANMQVDLAAKERQQPMLKARMYAMRMQMLRDVIAQADVICATCITSVSSSLGVVDFPVVFLDEASMSTEPASLIPLMKGSRHVALIGDHKQLPPIITSTEAKDLGLGKSLFERLIEEGVAPTIMLDTQYRMHPGISLFPSAEFYNFLLQDGTVDAGGNVSPHLVPPNSVHLKEDADGNRPAVIFLDHNGNESMRDKSRVNHNEAAIVLGVVEDLLLNNPKLKGQDIGIIAPYVAQISLITRMLNTNPKYRARFNEVLGEQRAMQVAHIEVSTVDGFEGREKGVIVFSTVRNNAGGHLGFLADQRRLNVGLTRAKRGLFVVGNLSTLGRGVRVNVVSTTESEREPVVVQPGEIKVIQAKEEKVLKAPTPRKSRGTTGHDKAGQDSWKRYAEWLLKRGLVVRLSPTANFHRPTPVLTSSGVEGTILV
ncbi:P-loop containing nucleoside triphosphate hydrolase protein [Mycena amicta]|nr:P-loop containing nucleoside triphosphate hydrolase protein [Mycena amicta]